MKQFIFLLTFSFVILVSKSQIVYTDINPDITVSLNSGGFTFNLPGTNEEISFDIYFDNEMSTIFYCSFPLNAEIQVPFTDSAYLYYNWYTYLTPKYSLNDTISDNVNWSGSASLVATYDGFWYGTNTYDYLGFRIPDGDSYRYGWIRLDTQGSHYWNWQVTVKDFAFNMEDSPFIIAGDGVRHRCTEVQLSDIADYNDGRDIQLNCQKAIMEEGIEEYRLYLIKSENAESFDLETAFNISDEYYYSFLPNATNPEILYESGTTDVEGDLISHDNTYNAFVLSVMETGSSVDGYLSGPSNTLQLHTYNYVSGISGADIGNNGNGKDLQINFTKAEDEEGISEYRIMLVDFLRPYDYYSQDPFTLAIADTIPEENYYTVITNGQDVSVVLGTNSRDVDGLLLGTGTYKIYVLVVSNGTTTNTNSLNEGDDLVSLTCPTDRYIITGQNSGNGIVYKDFEPDTTIDLEDISQYNFDLNDDMISDYYFKYIFDEGNSWHKSTDIYNTPYSDAISMQLNSGCVINHRLPWSQNSLIPLYGASEGGEGGYWSNWDRGYLALKMIHEEDTLYGYIDMRLFSLGEKIKIYGYAYFDPNYITTPTDTVNNISGLDIADFGNGKDLQVNFSKAENEEGISEYRIMLVDFLRPYDYYFQDPFTLAIADTIPEENYYTVIPNGQDVSVVLDANSRDINGLLLGTGTYKIYILVISNGTTTNTNSLSEGDGLVSLTNPSDRFIITGQNSGSGIVYTDVDPDTTISLEYSGYYFDLNGDSISDCSFEYYNYSGNQGWERKTKIFNEDHSFAITNQLDLSCVINHRLPWSQDYLIPLWGENETGLGGYWVDFDRGYLSLKMIHEEDTLYGYIDMQLLDTGKKLKIFEYAYFDPSSLNISEINQFVNVYPNPTSGFTKISVNDKIQSVDVYDITGKLIEGRVYDNPETNLYYDFSEYKKGLYFLKIIGDNNQAFTSKIVVQ